MADVAGGQRRPVRNRDPGDHRIAHFAGPTLPTPDRGEVRRCFGCKGVEREDSIFDDLLENAVGYRFQRSAAPFILHDCDAEPGFEQRHRGGPDR